MSFIFFFSFIIGTVLLVTRSKENESIRWLALCNYCASIGALSNVLRNNTIPAFKNNGIYETVIFFLHELSIYFQFLGQSIAPYAVLMYAIVFTKVTHSKIKNRLAIVLFIPVILMIFRTKFYPELDLDFMFLLIWSTPYYCAATYLIFRSWFSEKNQAIKKSKFNALVIVVPIYLGVYIFNNIPAAFKIKSETFLMTLPVIFGVGYLLFVIYIFLSGVFGLKVKVEQQALDRSLQIMSSGTAVLNHTIKNEIHKIKFFFLIAQEAAEKNDLIEAKEAIKSALPAIEHIDHMIERIKSKTEEIVLREDRHHLNDILLSSVQGFQGVLKAQKIQIEVSLLENVEMECDDVLLGEVIKNLLNNAIEAINQGDQGLIKVKLYRIKTEIALEIEDSGIGIPNGELARIMEPFFSTKKNSKNHGLGLSFCYNVMKAHQGTITFNSVEGIGTSVVLHFPKKRIVTSA
ncbi:sensor histidine kinase [Paenibacillus durus]|uniref:histidine kinase n=1 Tax=Paenibacillus durus TaxID=44251 RepID=A0A089HVD2_PAEDU|nr:sensor histidine kinase [Paenibacillus durus]AIQ15047.1 hypothetical protein PDUR_26620 [Paenibacillus durus]